MSYGNNFSIDTENVTYIENGPNFHTYTFNIIRENASPTDPVENLVLAPMTDGTYKELLITYHLTAAEKQTLMNGGFVDTKGKTTVTAISTGNYSSVLAKTQSCSYETITINISCSSGEHMPGQSGCTLKGNDRAKMYQVVGLVCSGDDGSGGSSGGGGGGSGGGGEGGGEPCPDCPTYGGGTPTEPCNGNGVATSPLDPTTDIGDGSTCTGVPTLPNLPNLGDDPCQKTKAILENPAVQTKLDSLKNHSTGTGELGFKIKKDGTTSDIIDGGKHEVDLGNMTGWQGAYHNHTSTGIPMHSPPDIDNGLLKLARSQPTQPVGEHNNAYFGMIVKKACSTCTGGFKIYHYVIRFNGTYADATTTFSQEKLDELKDTYRTLEKQLSETLPYVDFLGAANLNNKGLEKLFFETLTNMNISHNVVTLQRVDDDSNGNITVNNITLDTSGVPQAIPCP